MRISIKKVMSEAASFYRSNFNYIVKISLIICALQAFFLLRIPISPSPSVIVLIVILIVIWSTMVLVFWPKLILAILIIINSLLDGVKITLAEAYRQAKGKYWIVLSRYLIIGVIMFVPVLIIFLMRLPYPGAIGNIITWPILSAFYVLNPIIALEQKTTNYFSKALQKIKGNFVTALKLHFLTTTSLAIAYAVLSNVFGGRTTATVIVEIFYTLISVVVYPFAASKVVIVYRKLSRDTQSVSPGNNFTETSQ